MTRVQTFFALALAAALLLGLALGQALRSPRPPPGPSDEFLRQATPTEIRDDVRAADARLTVVNFWATWCEPCRREFPIVVGVARELAGRGVRLRLVSVDEATDFAEAEAFLRQMGVDFPTFYKGSQSLTFVSELWPKWGGAIPATLLLGPNAEVIDAWEGESSWKDMERRITRHLGAP